MERVVIYGRVSTNDQTTDNQTTKLNEIVEQNGWTLVDTYLDQGISGSKGRDQRPEFDRLCKDMVRRRFNRVLVWDVVRSVPFDDRPVRMALGNGNLRLV